MERVRDFLLDHRRPLAAACAALAVLTAMQSLRPPDRTVEVAVAARDLESGRLLDESDVTTVRMAVAARPDHVLDEDDAIGRRAAGPMRAGEPLTDRRVVSQRALDGGVLSMITVEDAGTLVGLRVGDRVDVVAPGDEGGRAHVVVSGADVTTLPDGNDQEVGVVGLTTTSDDALVLADAAVAGGLRLVVRS